MKQTVVCTVLLLTLSAGAVADTPQIEIMQFDRPVWLLGLEDARWLFDFRARADGAKVLVFPLANLSPSDGEPGEQREDEMGQFTRSLALFLSERIFAETTCRSFTEVPVVEGSGPVVSTKEWSLETLRAASRKAGSDLILSGAVERSFGGARSVVRIAVWDVATQKLEASLEEIRYFDSPDSTALALAERVIGHLVESSRCERLQAPAGWGRPPEDLAGPYLGALGQLLPQALAENEVLPATSLWGEADMLAWYASVRRRMPSSVPARLIYVRGVLASQAYGGSAYRSHASRLIREASGPAKPSDEVARLAPLIFARLGHPEQCESSKALLAEGAEGSFAEWLDRLRCE